MRRSALTLSLVATALAFACSRQGARDIGNENPRSQFADGPGSPARSRDVSADGGARGLATPAVTGRKPRELARASAGAIVTNPTHVFFGDAEDDTLYALPKSGGEPVRLARRAPMPNALSIDRETLVWIGSPGDVVLRVSTKGGSPSTLRDRGIFTDVTSSDDDVFFIEAQGGGGVLTRVTGTTAARLAPIEGSPHGVVVDKSHVYVATSSRIVRTTRTRGELTELATGIGFASPQLEDTWLYATSIDPKGNGRVIVRVNKAGGPLETIASGVRDAPIALHKGWVYWFDLERPVLLAAAPATGAASASAASPSLSIRTISDDPALDRPTTISVDDDGAFVGTGYGEGARVLIVPIK